MFEKIYLACNKRKIVFALLFDVTGVFSNVLKDQLLHNQWEKKIDSRIVAYIKSFLTNKFTIFRVNKHTTSKINTSIGIPQGTPLPPMFFLFYNSLLQEKLGQKDDILSAEFVDKIAVIVEGKI